MQYGGTGMIEGRYEYTKPAFDFLKQALMKVAPDLPYRGPSFFENGVGWVEEITKGGTLVFTQAGMGGIVIHKDEERKPVYPWNL